MKQMCTSSTPLGSVCQKCTNLCSFPSNHQSALESNHSRTITLALFPLADSCRRTIYHLAADNCKLLCKCQLRRRMFCAVVDGVYDNYSAVSKRKQWYIIGCALSDRSLNYSRRSQCAVRRAGESTRKNVGNTMMFCSAASWLINSAYTYFYGTGIPLWTVYWLNLQCFGRNRWILFFFFYSSCFHSRLRHRRTVTDRCLIQQLEGFGSWVWWTRCLFCSR